MLLNRQLDGRRDLRVSLRMDGLCLIRELVSKMIALSEELLDFRHARDNVNVRLDFDDLLNRIRITFEDDMPQNARVHLTLI